MQLIYKLLLVVCFALLFTFSLEAQVVTTVDTIKFYRDKGMNKAFPPGEVDLQTMRCSLPREGSITAIHLWVNGKPTKEAGRVRIFGWRGGDPVPSRTKDMVAPLTFSKTGYGLEKVVVTLPFPLKIIGSSFFVGVDRLADSISLLTDDTYRTALCNSNTPTGSYYLQQLRTKSGRWFNAPFAYKISVVASYDDSKQDEPATFTGASGLERDTTLLKEEEQYVGRQRSIAVGDMNKDTWLDILANNQLFLSGAGRSFRNISTEIGLKSQAQVSFFVDINGDGFLDIVQIQTEKGKGTLFINQGNNKFTQQEFKHPDFAHVSTYSIGYINGDRIPDIFIGQYEENTLTTNYLLLSEPLSQGYQYKALAMPVEPGTMSVGTKGANFIDMDNDGHPELYVSSTTNQPNMLYTITATAGTEYIIKGKAYGMQTPSAYSSGCFWGDIDHAGTLSLLQPHDAPFDFQVADHGESLTLPLPASKSARPFDNSFIGSRYSGGCLADINNDGKIDILASTSCRCRSTDILLQTGDHQFTPAGDVIPFLLGGSTDIVVADLNNDGTLDLPMILDDSLVIYKNNFRQGNYTSIDLTAKDGYTPIGSSVEVHSGTEVYTIQVISGRGQLAQDPVRLHYGLSNKRVDSVIVTWGGPGKNQEVFRDVTANGLNVLEQGKGHVFTAKTGIAFEFSAYPNPSAKYVHLKINSDQALEGECIIADLKGQVIRMLPVGMQAGESQITWDGMDSQSTPVSTGVYIITLKAGGLTKFCRVEISR